MSEKPVYALDILSVFNTTPGCHLVLLPNAPHYTIVGATDEYLSATYLKREDAIGQGVFEANTDNPANPFATGVKNLSASLDAVLRNKSEHRMTDQRYDVRNPLTGEFERRVWSPLNRPVLDGRGHVQYIIHSVENITEKVELKEKQRADEQKILEREARFRSLIEEAPVATCLFVGREMIIEEANEAMIQVWGKGPNVIGLPLAEALPELKGQHFLPLLDELFTTGQSYSAKGGRADLVVDGKLQTFYFDYDFKPLRNGEGDVYAIMETAIDVTEQVLARRKIEESEAKFRIMAESTPVLIAVADETSNAIYFNKAWSDVTGRPMQDLIEYGWVDLLHPDDRDHFVTTFQDAHTVKGPFTGEFRVVNTKGEYRWLLAHGVPRFHTDGSFAGHISACTDITEQKLGEQQLQTALEQVRLSKEAAELGTFDMDLEKGTMHWDQRCRTLFGISHQGPVTYEKDFAQGLHPDDKERVLQLIDRLFNKSISNGDYDVEYRTIGAEDGVVRWVRAKGKVYFDAQDKPIRFIGSVLDITEKVMAIQKIEAIVEERTKELARANETLQNINRELQRSNQNLEEFAHAASHDLKEPVRKIHFFTHQLREQLSQHLSESEIRSFSRIENATQRMGNLIDDLLLYSHVSHRPHETESIDLNEKVQRVLEDLDLDIEEKRATINVAKLPVVQGYRRQLQQLFQNLISNALKYSKGDEPPQIDIDAEVVEKEDKAYHLVSIKDNGIGFDPVYSEKIFQMFTRLHGKAEYSGTGVGLSIVKKVVENHNGFIEAESTENIGSTFKIYLPA
jgi:PAS domain S-box-containing protein